jgi:hypothetical protein
LILVGTEMKTISQYCCPVFIIYKKLKEGSYWVWKKAKCRTKANS